MSRISTSLMTFSHLRSSKRVCVEVNNANEAITCMVDDCAADLSESRKYYQRHKVCEFHSKSPHVSVHGRILRFCQQCSRFHSLEAFDEGKRSCRRRLDGHNRRRRRRKPRRPYILPQNGIDMAQFTAEQMQFHPTMSFMNPLWSGVVEVPTLVDHSNHDPSPLQASYSTLSHVVHTPSDTGLDFMTTSALDHELGYGGWEDDCDMGWDDMIDMVHR